MPITLAEAKVGMTDKVNQQVVDTFRRSSLLLDRMTFDNMLSPGTGGSTLGYTYVQLKTPSTAGVRQINTEYTANEAKREEKSTKAIIMGGSFQVDRVIQNTSGAVDEMAFQMEQKIKATANQFHNNVINGTSASSGAGYVPNTFDGLKKMLTGTSSELSSGIDISDANAIGSNAYAFLDQLDALVAAVDGDVSMLMMNGDMLLKVKSVARRAGYYSRQEDAFGRTVEYYGNIPLVDLGKYYNGTKSVDVVDTSAASSSTLGKTSIYSVSLGLDGFFGISPTGTGVIQTFLPDMTAPGAVKTGEVELVAGVALRNTLKAAVLTDIGIKPKTA